MRSTTPTRSRRAFTMVELMAVVVVVSILVGVGFFAFTQVQQAVKTNQARDLLRNVATAERAAFTSRGSFVSADTTTSPYANLAAVAPNPAGYVGPKSVPTQPLQISASKGLAAGSIPYLSLATTTAAGQCVMLATFPTHTGRKDLESTATPAQLAAAAGGLTCTAANASVYLHVDQLPAGATVPAAPTGVTLTSGPATLYLSWAPTSGAAGYRVYRTSPGGTAQYLSDVSGATSFADAGLNAATSSGQPAQYAYYVVAYSPDGFSPASATVTGVPGAGSTLPPSQPTNLVATAVTATGTTITWQPAATNPGTAFKVVRDGATLAILDAGDANHDGYVLGTQFIDATATTAGVQYAYQVYSLNDTAVSSLSSANRTVTTPPAAPTSPAATPQSSTAVPGGCGPGLCVQLAWGTPPAATGSQPKAPATSVRVYRCATSSCPANAANDPSALSLAATVSPTTTSFTDTNLDGATAYTYYLFALNAAGTSWAASSAVTTTAPPQLTGVAAAPNGPGGLQVTWPTPTGYTATGFTIQNKSAGVWTSVTTTAPAATSWSTSGLAADADYTYRVVPVSAAGAGLASAEVTTSVLASAPSGLTATPLNSTSVKLTWSPVPGATYEVRRADGTRLAGPMTATSYTDSGLSAATTYSYYVRSYTAAGYQATNTVSTTTASADAPTVTASASGTSVTLTWGALPQATGYRIFSCDPAPSGYGCANPTAVLDVASGTTYTFTNQALATKYTYALAALVAGTPGVLSRTATTSTASSPPAAPTNAVYNTTTKTFSWDRSVGATSYRLYRVPAGGVATQVVEVAQVPGTSQSVVLAQENELQTAQWYVTAWYPDFATETAGTYFANGSTIGTTIAAPTRVQATAVAPGSSVTLTWTSTHDQFQVVRCDGICDPTQSTSAGYTSTTTSSSATTATVSGLSAPKTYTFAVRVSSASVGGAWSPWSSPVTVSTFVAPPSSLNAVAASTAGSSTLTWAGSGTSGVTGYTLYDNGVLVGTLTSSPATVTGTPGDQHKFTLAATTALGSSPQVAAVPKYSGTTIDPPALTVVAQAPSDPKFSWPAVPGATHYQVFWCDAGAQAGCTPTTLIADLAAVSGTNSYTHIGAALHNRYHVLAVRDSTVSPTGAVVSTASIASNVVALDGTPPPPPPLTATLTAGAGGNSNVTFSWTSVPGSSQYRVRDADSLAVMCTTAATTCSPGDVSAITPGASRRFQIATLDGAGNVFAWGSPITVLGTPAQPAAPTFAAVVGGWKLTAQMPSSITSFQLRLASSNPYSGPAVNAYTDTFATTDPGCTLSAGTYTCTVDQTRARWYDQERYVWYLTVCSAAACSVESPASAQANAGYQQIAPNVGQGAGYASFDTAATTDAFGNPLTSQSNTPGLVGNGFQIASGVGGADLTTNLSGQTDYAVGGWVRNASGTSTGPVLSLGGTDNVSAFPQPTYSSTNGWAGRSSAPTMGTSPDQVLYPNAIPLAPVSTLGYYPAGRATYARDFTLIHPVPTAYLYLYCPDGNYRGESGSAGSFCTVWIDGRTLAPTTAQDSVVSLGALGVGDHHLSIQVTSENAGSQLFRGLAGVVRSSNSTSAPVVSDSAGRPLITDSYWRLFTPITPAVWSDGSFYVAQPYWVTPPVETSGTCCTTTNYRYWPHGPFMTSNEIAYFKGMPNLSSGITYTLHYMSTSLSTCQIYYGGSSLNTCTNTTEMTRTFTGIGSGASIALRAQASGAVRGGINVWVTDPSNRTVFSSGGVATTPVNGGDATWQATQETPDPQAGRSYSTADRTSYNSGLPRNADSVVAPGSGRATPSLSTGTADLRFGEATGSSETSQSGAANILDGNWHLWLISVSGGVATLYVDGVAAETSTLRAGFDPGNQVALGKIAGTGTSLFDHLDATYDELGVWRKSFTASDANELFQAGRSPQ